MFIFNCRWVARRRRNNALQVFESVGLGRSSCGRVGCKRSTVRGKESTSRRSGKFGGGGDPVRLIPG